MSEPGGDTLALDRGDVRDLPDVMIAMREAFDPAFGEAWTEAQCSGIMSMPGTWLVLARLGGEVAGFALARAIGGEGELLLLAVRPACRRRGVGGRLLANVLDEARRQGMTSLHLEVRAGNDAIRLYSAAGFREVGRRRDYYRGADGKSFDALTYSRDLTSEA